MNVRKNNIRLAKNTIFLYIRLLFALVVGLYTSRIVLEVLGNNDFGLYSVVSSIILMLIFLNSFMSGATSRFLAYELGRNDTENLKKTFSSSFLIHTIIAFVILILGETIGLWFMENKMVIPEGRIAAARCVYQISLISSFVTITQVPYHASIIAHEKMNIYAYVEIIKSGLQLISVYLLTIGNYDKLILLSVLNLCVYLTIAVLYRLYCLKNYRECRISLHFDKKIVYCMLSFSIWDFYGNIADSAKNHGVNVLLNMFFGTLVNAAYGIAYQVGNAVNSFTSNVLLAVKPQLIKYYAEGKITEMGQLVINSTKYSLILFFMFAWPIILEMDFLLNIWLKNVPEHANIFCIMFVIILLIAACSENINYAIHATGKIKKLCLITGTLSFLIPIITYCFFKLGNKDVYTPFYIIIGMEIIITVIRLIILHEQLHLFPIYTYLKNIFLVYLKVLLLSSIIPLFIRFHLQEGWIRFLFITATSVASIIITTFFFALSSQTRYKAINVVSTRFKKTT